VTESYNVQIVQNKYKYYAAAAAALEVADPSDRTPRLSLVCAEISMYIIRCCPKLCRLYACPWRGNK